MTPPQGPGSPFHLLFSDVPAAAPSLPESFRQIYPGDWHLLARQDRPYIYSNFATSRDGRISYELPEAPGGGAITRDSQHDLWLMGLLRGRADALLSGDVTLNIAPEALYTAQDIYPPDAPAFAALRQAEGYRPTPLLVILSLNGDVNFGAACFQQAADHIVLATTTRGAAKVAGVQSAAKLDILTLGEQAVDLPKLIQILHNDYGVKNLLCEGGARVFAGMLAAHLIDEEFITLSATFVGRNETAFRPSYTEGVAWHPDQAPYSKPLSLHRVGDLLFMRTRCQYPREPSEGQTSLSRQPE